MSMLVICMLFIYVYKCIARKSLSSFFHICSLLVNIYGSYEMFVAEYRNLLADRLLQSFNFDVSREVSRLVSTYV